MGKGKEKFMVVELKAKVSQVGDEIGLYEVESSDSKSLYSVDMRRGTFNCSCGHFQYRLKRVWDRMNNKGQAPNPSVYCKHMFLALDYLKNN